MQAVCAGDYLNKEKFVGNNYLPMFCITLKHKRCKSRQESFYASATKYNWEFEFFFGSDCLDKSLNRFYKEEKCLDTGFKASPAEIACAMSHRNLLKKIISDENEYTIVCEDDVEISRSGPQLIPSHEFDILFLNTRCKHNNYGELWGASCCGTDSYLITLKGAKKIVKMLEKSRVLRLPIDMLILSQSLSLRTMGHHICKHQDNELSDIYAYHADPISIVNESHKSLLEH
tara:strand:- start:9256 stop:9948 length:693 start_codon:yes stop_codon:yes gene_type:complete